MRHETCLMAEKIAITPAVVTIVSIDIGGGG